MFGMLRDKLSKAVKALSDKFKEKEEKKEEPKQEKPTEQLLPEPIAKKEPETKGEDEKIEGVLITYFVHGTTTDNEKGVATGWAPGELSEAGITQAKELGKTIAGREFGIVFCSDLKRAIDSANLVFGNKYEIVQDRRLREANYGDFAQKPSKEFKSRMIDYVDNPFPNGESYKDVERRVADFLNFLYDNYYGKRVAIVAHQAPQLALEVLLNRKSWKQAIAEDWRAENKWQPGWEYALNEKVELPEEKKEEPKPTIVEKKTEPIIEKPIEKPKQPEKKSFIKKIFEKAVKTVTETRIEEKDLLPVLNELETDLIEADVAIEVAERIKSDLTKELVGKEIKRGKENEEIVSAFKHSLLGILDVPSVDLEKLAEAKKPAVLLFLGFNGSGKCVSGDTLIPLSDGRLVSAEEIYNEAKGKWQEKSIEDGFIIEPSEPPEVFTVEPSGLKTKSAPATVIWKLKKTDLVEVLLENGHGIKVTPEHPFFVLRSGAIRNVRADALHEGEYVMIPKKISVSGAKPPSGIDLLRMMSDRKLFVHSPFVREAYKLLSERYRSLREARIMLEVTASESRFVTQWKKENMIPSTLAIQLYNMFPELRRHFTDVKVKYGKSSTLIPIPTFDENFYEFLGLFYAEGYINKQYIEFTNTEDMLLKKFNSLVENVFGRKGVIKSDARQGRSHIKKVIVSNRTVSHMLRKILNIGPGRKSSIMKIPDFILSSDDEKIAAMIKTYWAGDGHINKVQRCLESTTASRMFALQLSATLLRFGIITTISSKAVMGKEYYRISIFGKEKIERFAKSIGTIGECNEKRMANIIGMPSQFEKTELIPMQGGLLRALRHSFGVTQLEIAQNLAVGNSLISQYETRGISIPADKLSKISSMIDSGRFLKCISEGDVRWSRVHKKTNIKGDGFVYDFTVAGTHNFIANNIIVHNTTSIAKVANFLKERGHTVVLAAADSWRAAAIEQLEEHGSKIGVNVIKHNYGSDPAAVVYDAVEHAKAKGIEYVLADSAGRVHTNQNLMQELQKMVRVNKPDLKILIIDSMTGNDALEQARAFGAVGVDAVIFTKVDVNEKGGAILSVTNELRKPILFLGVGQEYKDFEKFDAEKFVNRVLS